MYQSIKFTDQDGVGNFECVLRGNKRGSRKKQTLSSDKNDQSQFKRFIYSG